jgi:hypothetical protein
MISILEQVVRDYIPERVAQIWNYLSQYKADEYVALEGGNASLLPIILSSPFSSPYNVTTFNQVYSATISPHRKACVRGLYLKDAVIILDEVQKLPVHSLLYGLPMIQKYARENNCCLIFSSATPLPLAPVLFPYGLPASSSHSRQVLYSDPLLMNRRSYEKIPAREEISLGGDIERSISAGKREFFLLSLVTRGTFAVARLLGLSTDPFKRITMRRTAAGVPHPVVWLDGTVPPFERIRYLRYIQRRLHRGLGITLLTTQVVEAGVDFGGRCFENGYTDFMDIASLVQRGGRVNREGVLTASKMYVFDFFADEKQTSKAILNRLTSNFTNLGKDKATLRVKSLLRLANQRLDDYFTQWRIGEIRDESRLIDDNEQLLSGLFANRRAYFSDLVELSATDGLDGFSFNFLHTISDLYIDDDEQTYLVFPSQAEAHALRTKLLAAIQYSNALEREICRHRTRMPERMVEDLQTNYGFRLEQVAGADTTEILLYPA